MNMLKRFLVFIVAICCIAPAWADVGGHGYPSRPRFQSVAVVGSQIPDNGIYLASANTFCWSTANVQRFCTNGNGNVTLNVPSSGPTLRIGGVGGIDSLQLSNATNNPYLGWWDSTYATRYGYLQGTSSGIFLGADSSGAVNLVSAGGNRIVADSSGNVSISPASTFTVAGVNLTPSTGSFTLTLTSGCTTTPGTTVFYVKTGNQVTLQFSNNSDFFQCTSNATSKVTDGATSMPASLRPARTVCSPMVQGMDNNTNSPALIEIRSTGAIYIARASAIGGVSAIGCSGTAETNWSNVGTFDVAGVSFSYQLL